MNVVRLDIIQKDQCKANGIVSIEVCIFATRRNSCLADTLFIVCFRAAMSTAEEMITLFLQETLRHRRLEHIPEHGGPGICEGCCIAGLYVTHSL